MKERANLTASSFTKCIRLSLLKVWFRSVERKLVAMVVLVL